MTFALNSWNEVENRVEKAISNISFSRLKEYRDLESCYAEYSSFKSTFKGRIDAYNDAFLKKKIEEAYGLIGTVEGRKLDEQQMSAVVKDAPSQLVVAGAGSGKTTTIVGKVKYLLATGIVKAEDILVLSFTNASAAEMKERIRKECGGDIYTATFHKLGYEIIKRSDKIAPKVADEDIRSFVSAELENICENDKLRGMIVNYVLYQSVQAQSEFSFKTAAEYKSYLETNPPTTFLGERVKSYGEMTIANFLTQHGIRYEYEAEYPVDTRTEEYGQYHPDFYLPDHDIYIEYFGINRQGDVPSYFNGKNGKSASQVYTDGMDWKRKLHAENSTRLVECFAYEFFEDTLVKDLGKKLSDEGVDLQERSLDSLFSEGGNKRNQILSMLANTIATVVVLLKNRKMTVDELESKCRQVGLRQDLLLSLAGMVFEAYERMLHENEMVDFADMLNRAEELVRNNEYRHTYKYVIVDEYQDISAAQYRLLRAMRDQTDYLLFCVGDDWQSIYRFAGSDISYIVRFADYWERTDQSYIGMTYRFPQKLIDISGQFIMKNPYQIKKELHSYNTSKDQVLAWINAYNENAANSMLIESLMVLPKEASVFLLGRYGFDIDQFKDCERLRFRYDNVSKIQRVELVGREDLKIVFYTVHRSKGLQADYVYIINNRQTHMGFPSEVKNPPVIELLLEQADPFPDAEERRLYYVALTRAKKRVYLLTVGKNISMFARELIEEHKSEIAKNGHYCPECGGKMQRRKGPYGEFYGCSNYRINGCRYKEKIGEEINA